MILFHNAMNGVFVFPKNDKWCSLQNKIMSSSPSVDLMGGVVLSDRVMDRVRVRLH